MRKLELRIGQEERTCPILINTDAKEALAIAKSLKPSKIAIVFPKSMEPIANRLAGENAEEIVKILCTDGEKTKSLATVEQLYLQFMQYGLDRHSVVIIVGGGTVGDTVAFACSTYMRGIRFILTPTTLLAMADSAIGGKNGVNFNGKNIIGTFNQPEAVVIDLKTLSSLPEREIRNGLAEILKVGLIGNASLVEEIRNNSEKIHQLDGEIVESCLAKAIAVKIRIVEGDEKEDLHYLSDKSRMLLNFGHTVGHALEKLTNHNITHGDAIAIGMAAETKICEMSGVCREGLTREIETLLDVCKLPSKIPPISLSAIMEEMKKDKKADGGKIRIAGIREIGQGTVVGNLDGLAVIAALEECLT